MVKLKEASWRSLGLEKQVFSKAKMLLKQVKLFVKY